MNNNNRFTLEPYKGKATRHECPACKDKESSFSRYIDTTTGAHVHPSVGKCNRVSKCAYHYTPKQYFTDNKIVMTAPSVTHRPTPAPQREPSFISGELFKRTLKNYDQNNFVSYLIGLFGQEVTSKLISKYYIGTSKHWPDSTIFWQYDTKGKIRTGKVIQYDNNGHRIKSRVTWVHSLLNKPDFELKQCFFGEHLLKNSAVPIAIVESEKSAIVASVYLPGYTWLASGGAEGLNLEKCSILKNRKVVLFPDLKMFDKWTLKAKEFNDRMIGTRFFVSDYLEKHATEADKTKGLDIADYLERYDFKTFTATRTPSVTPTTHNRLEPVLVGTMPKEPALIWHDGRLLRSMQLHEIADSISWFN